MELTLEQKIGQLMMIGWPSDDPKDVIELIKKYHFGNIILFTRNIKSLEQVKKMTKEIQEAAIKYNGVPAFISIDQEGGSVRRIYEGVTSVPGHMAIGAASYSRHTVAREVGKIIGQELKYAGINFNLAPVADINNNPYNPVIAIRAFSDDPELVSKLAFDFSRGLQEEGVLSSYKHFIGHGDVTIDSHLDLPYLATSLEELRKVELVPYLNPKVPDAIMTAHILYEKLDDRFPASISKKIIKDLLRNELKYEGLVVTDCYEMDALSRAFSLEEAAIFAIAATTDIITVSHTFGKQLIVRNALLQAVLNQKLSIKEIDRAVENILRIKEKYTTPFEEKQIDFIKNQRIAEECSLASVTKVSGELFPIDEDTVVIGVTNYINSIAEDTNIENMDIAKLLGEHFHIAYRSIDNKNFSVNEIAEAYKHKKIILALSDSHLTLVQKVLYSTLVQQSKEILLISLRTPYDVLGQNLPTCHLALYEYTRLSIQSLIKVLEGYPARGLLPVQIKRRVTKEPKIKNYLVRNIHHFLEENYGRQLTLEEVADEHLISVGYLCRLFKRETGQTFIEYLTNMRIQKSKKLLTQSNLKVYEIAYLTGFSDMNYFSKIFKKVTGTSPTNFRLEYGYFDTEKE